MAQPSLDWFKKRALLIKAESTEGTDSVPVAATDGFRLFDGSSTTEFDKIERPMDKAFFGGDPFGIANRRAKIEGEFELYPPATPGGASTSDADAARVLFPAGMAVVKNLGAKTSIYSPISSAIPTVTAYWYHVDSLLKVTGARANLSGLALEIGQRFKAKAMIQGNYTSVDAAAMAAPVLPTKVPVVASARNLRATLSTLVTGATASTAGTPLANLLVWAKSLSIDFGNDLKHKEYSSLSVNQISDRKPTFTMKLARTDITNDFNPWFVRDNGIVLTASVRLFENAGTPGATLTGLYSCINVRAQIENITRTDIDGDYGWEITGPCLPSSAGGDEFSIEFGDQA